MSQISVTLVRRKDIGGLFAIKIDASNIAKIGVLLDVDASVDVDKTRLYIEGFTRWAGIGDWIVVDNGRLDLLTNEDYLFLYEEI